MIIKIFRYAVGYGSEQTKNHIFAGADNIEVRHVKGSPADLDDMFADARAAGKSYAVRHVIIAPREAMTIAEMMAVLDQVAAEYGLDMGRAIIVAHHKARVEPGCNDWHLHGMFPDHSASGRVHDNHNNYRRNEVLARICEAQHRHPFVHGKHHRWVYEELLRRGYDKIAADLVKAIPLDTPRPTSSLAAQTIQAFKDRGINASELRKFFRTTWRDTAEDPDAKRLLVELLAARGITIERGTGEPPVWVVHAAGLFLFTVAGGLPGVRVTTINSRLGDPTDERTETHSAEKPGPDRSADAADHRRTSREADPQSVSTRATDGLAVERADAASFAGRRSAELAADKPVGSDRRDPRRPGESDAGGARSTRRRDGVDFEAGRVRHAQQRPVLSSEPIEERYLIRARAMRGRLAGIAGEARLASEEPRLRVERRLTAIEATALAVTIAAETPSPDTGELIAARAAQEAARVALSKAWDFREAAELRYTTIRDAPAPRLFGRRAHTAEFTAADDAYSSAKDIARAADATYDKAKADTEMLVKIAAKFEAGRQQRAKEYAQHLALVLAVRASLDRSPRMAAAGAPALLAIAADDRRLSLIDWEDLWGVPHPRPAPYQP